MKKTSPPDGFSLIEVAIVLIIIGIMGGMGISLLIHQMSLNRHKISHHHHEAIFRSLAAYALRKEGLPYAANPASRKEKFGLAQSSQTIGIVPFKTLGLPESMVKDGYKNYITYIVQEKLCGGGSSKLRSTRKTSAKKDGICEIKAIDAARQSITISDYTFDKGHFIAVALISHGSQGHGAFLCNGTKNQKRAPLFGVKEELNAHALKSGREITLYKHPYSTHKDTLFRHHVSFVTRDNLMSIYALNPCKPKKKSS